ncbi:GATA transcription factor 11-like [Solanum stenotomum]|uniref:GATA transcription factor 11-like n=1 Tax=Solanum stenotomum TaxID=172797 RepID=UPI0020D04498|nr:GATA transcription factor 11-like [Solanum stenotomum]
MTMVEHGGGYMDGVPTGPIVDDDFDDILNFLDMPMESLEEDGLGGVEWDVSESKGFGPIPTDALMDFPPMPQGNIGNRRVNAVAKSHPHPPIKFTEVQGTGTFQTQSPVSVLEGSNSCSGGKSIPIKHDIVIPVRPRSKRARPSAVNPWILMAPISSTRVASSKKISDARKMKEKRRRLSLLSGAKEPMKNYVQQINDAALPLSDVYKKKITSTQQSSFFKKCTHCEVTKTPQWREGPLGPKTLCNACGVRYRSGRLFPEYRPAASPTFVPSVHSNSHRKVVEMRKKTLYGTGEVEEPPKVIMGRKSEALPEPTILADPAMSPAPEFVPMSSYLFDVY